MNTFPKTHTQYVGLRLSSDLKRKLDEMAHREHVSIAVIVRRAIEREYELYLPEREETDASVELDITSAHSPNSELF